MISPIFEEMSMEFGNATFLKVNTDEARGMTENDLKIKINLAYQWKYQFLNLKKNIQKLKMNF